MDTIAEEVRQRALASVDTIAASIKDSVPYGDPKPDTKAVTFDAFMNASPQMRQAILQADPANSSTLISGLMSEAANRFGGMAAEKLRPMFEMDQLTGAAQQLEQAQAAGGDDQATAGAAAELMSLLGIDPFQ